MRKLLLVIFLLVILAACTTPTIYTKSITITKDAEGDVVETVITESIQQPNQQGYPVRFEHLKGVALNEK